MGMIIYAVGAILSLVCLILILIQLFKKEGVGLGILGIFCTIYAYIWGWIKCKELGLKNIMIAWTAGIVLAGVGWGLFVKAAISDPDSEFQKAMKNAEMQIEKSNPVPTPP